MTRLLTEQGLRIGAFEPALAAALGNRPGEAGANLIAACDQHGRSQVQLRDWLYCLVRAPGTLLRKHLINAPGKDPGRLISRLEDALRTGAEPEGAAPDRLDAASVSEAVLQMLEEAERLARADLSGHISDRSLSLALWQGADQDLKRLLEAWLGKEEGVPRLTSDLNPRPRGLEPLCRAEDGRLVPSRFDRAGWQLCTRMLEDAASMGATRISTRHLLYSMLGDESGSLHVALAAHGIDVKRDLHARLARELVRGARSRSEKLALCRADLFDATLAVLTGAQAEAQARGAARIGEPDIAVAFVTKQAPDLLRVLTGHHQVDLDAVLEVLRQRQAEPPAPQDAYKELPVAEIATKIKERILGQDGAIEAILPWIKRLRFGLRRDGRPAGVFLFLGPTGTGKTQLAKELARYVFGDPERMIFIEMGQFKTKESMTNLVGASPGYVGYGDGKLTNGLRDLPESVVLFDEIEKADPQVFDTILRFADEGLISDPAGPIRDGRKCIIVMTTNAGQTWLQDYLRGAPARRPANPQPSAGEGSVGSGEGPLAQALFDALRSYLRVASPDADEVQPAASVSAGLDEWRLRDPRLAERLFEAASRELRERGIRPELLGRVDEKLVFRPFTPDTCQGLVEQVLKTEEAKFALQGVRLEVDKGVRARLARATFERSLAEGARAAPRAINAAIVSPAIDALSAGPGDEGPGRRDFIRFFCEDSGPIQWSDEP